jgi:taurine dioxygenase
MAISIRPLGEHIGAEVTGLDLRQPVDADSRARLNDALARHVALVFRDQDLTPLQFVEAAGIFGPTMAQHFSQYTLPDHPHLATVSSREGAEGTDANGRSRLRATMWHTDHTNHERPPKATLLYGVKIPKQGGNTSIADMRAAYEALADEEKQRVGGMKTVNNLAVDPARGGTIRALPDDAVKHSNDVLHPMVRTHPDTGARALYFHVSKTERIEGMTPEASTAFLQDLLDRSIKPEFIYRHQWRKGDVLAFDNRCAMHRAHGDFDRRQHRLLYRVIVEGDRPV